MLCGGEALARSLADRLLAKADVLWNLYGPTETTIWSATTRVDPAQADLGRPIANTQVYLLNERLQPVPIGVPGELYIGGDGLARGYRGRPDLTAERFVPDPFAARPGARLYRTGDRARYQADGTLQFLGRVDHQVKLRGYRIELGEIEAMLSGMLGGREAIVLARPDEAGEARLVAYLPASPGDTPAPAELRRALKQTLPDYMVPSAFVTLAAWPLTPNGKVDRQALPAPDGDDAGTRATAFVAPGTPAEIGLARIWAEVLHQERVGREDNFFDLGGHSLLATQVVARVQATFGVALPVRNLFETPTVAALAAQIAEAPVAVPGAEAATPILRLERDAEAALPDLDSLSDEEVAALLGELLDDEDRMA
jgi:acyl carrier protein